MVLLLVSYLLGFDAVRPDSLPCSLASLTFAKRQLKYRATPVALVRVGPAAGVLTLLLECRKGGRRWLAGHFHACAVLSLSGGGGDFFALIGQLLFPSAMGFAVFRGGQMRGYPLRSVAALCP